MANDVKLEKVAAWFNKTDRDIFISCDDPRLVDENGKHSGITIAVSPTRHAKTYARLERMLADAGNTRPG